MATKKICDICGCNLFPANYRQVQYIMLGISFHTKEICPTCMEKMIQLIKEERNREHEQRSKKTENVERV